MKNLVLLDLFSGIGGFPKGLNEAGFIFRKHYFSEIDKYAIANYKYNFKKAIHVGAVESISKKSIIPKPDIITFGSPCQDLSIAGKRKGIQGSKSKLFFEAIRVINELQPRMFIFENVKGLFSSNQGKDFEVVLRSFADLRVYDFQWQLLNTAWFLPQNRERIYLVGSLRTQPRPQVFPIGENNQTNLESRKSLSQANIAPTVSTRVGADSNYGPYIFTLRGRKKGGGQNVEFRKDKSTNCITSSAKHNFLLEKWHPLRSVRNEKAKAIRRKNQKEGIDYAPFREREFEVRLDGITGALTTNTERENLLTNMKTIRRFTPLECERLQGFPDGWTSKGVFDGEIEPISDSQRYKLLGNAVSVPVVKRVGERISKSLKLLKKEPEESPLEGLDFVKTPITYYGGKQRLVNLILSLIPKHKLYCEPFLGGAAVFFAKEPSEMEVINDLNGEVVNFYRVCHNHFQKLDKLIKATPHSRQVHRETQDILKHPNQCDAIKRAWAFWVQTNMSFSSRIFGGYAYERKSNGTLKRFVNKKLVFDQTIRDRLEMVDIENNDALQVIKSRDAVDSFFYCDPPYFNSNMGHYKGYTEKDFEELLNMLASIKGKFLLSSYPSEILDHYTKKHRWYTLKKSTEVAVTKQTDKVKTEVLTANYPLENNLSGIDEAILVNAKAIKLRFQLI
ncbi:DNA (cytosine-5-)-methyltransferase [Aquimarina sp. U1-2]|uniref:DNA (cytosine-5-)-methyltransferase n=1 Tax=Aquimarina sp. U1-2 TaxID=2823141 RepID=UPI001AECC2F7|nr:DNA (cytosine-5-)-methyltransferase [Aquimarina sp. U1-2]MBP2831282.1 DNA (cytosine-5-)-methyltransferase [Aquimarina sp. U1-2]